MNNRKKLLISLFGGIGLFVLILLGLISYCGSVGATIAYINGESVCIYPKKLDLGNQKPGTETVAVFYMKNLTSKNISVVGEKSSCNCTFSEKIPITAQAGQTVELRIKIYFPKYESDYDQMISFMAAEPKHLTTHPVQVTAKIPNPLEKTTPVESKEKNDNPQTEDNKS
jgi:effector-binding domain-containing protein